jgi:CIC family chloride channel protein
MTAPISNLSSARNWLRRRVWLARWLPARDQRATFFWSVLAGLVGAAAVLSVRVALEGVQWLLTQNTGPLIEVAKSLPTWRRIATPAVGGLLAGFLIQWGQRFLRNQTASDYMEAVAVGDGVVRGRPAVLRTLASLFSISSGGSLGREGPLLQLAAALTSSAGRRAGLRPPRLPLMVASAAAAGLAATYHAPLGCSLFIAEVVLGTLAMESIGPLVLASVVAVAVTRPILGSQAIFPATVFRFATVAELPFHLLTGVLLGAAAAAFVHLLAAARSSFAALRLPPALQLGLGGLIVGGVSVAVPEVWGNGHTALDPMLRGEALGWTALTLLLVAKLAATLASVGSGAIGGVFTPTLLLGGLGGWFLGALFHRFFPGWTGVPASYALIGMGAFLAATTHAPLTAVVLVFEMTLNPDSIAPLLLASVAAFFVARGFNTGSIYTAQLHPHRSSQAPVIQVQAIQRDPPPSVPFGATLEAIAHAFHRARAGVVAVVQPDGRVIGAVRLTAIQPYLDDADLCHLVTAGDLAGDLSLTVSQTAPLTDALAAFQRTNSPYLVVVDESVGGQACGLISRRDLLLTLAHGAEW